MLRPWRRRPDRLRLARAALFTRRMEDARDAQAFPWPHGENARLGGLSEFVRRILFRKGRIRGRARECRRRSASLARFRAESKASDLSLHVRRSVTDGFVGLQAYAR